MAERASPLRSGYDFEVVSPQLTPEDIHRETFGDESGGGLVREAVKGLRRYADARTTNDLATRALDAQLEGNTAQADELLQDRVRRAAYSAPNAARVGRASDIGGVGDFVDWFGSAVGEGLPSMGPALVGAAVGRGALGRVLGSKTSAALGAAAPTYQDIYSSEVAGQFDDPVLAATSAEERARVARQTAVLGTGLGVLLPARLTGGFSKGGRELLKDIAVENATEGGENLISQYGRRQLDPTRDYDFVEALDSAAAGGAVGAATGARVRTAQEAISSAKDAYANWSSGRGKPDGTPGGAPGGDPGGAPGGAPAAPSGLFDRVSESFSESGAVVRERAQSVAKSFEDAITDVVGPERAQAFRDRFNAAVGDVGGSISAMKDRLSEFADQEFGPEVADQIRATSEAMSKAGGDLGASASRFADAVKDRASEFDTTELRERMSAGVNKAKDAMSSGLDRMTEAMKTSKSPDEFLRKAFGSTIEEEAAADLDDNNLIGLRGATEAETAANIDRDDAARVERANRFARELMDDPATPDSVRERVASMQGDFSDPSNQKYLSRTLVAMRGGQKAAQAAADLMELSKDALGKAKKAAGKAVSDVADAVVKKKNLQSASPAEQAAFNKVIFDNLTEEAKASTFVRAQLSQVTNVLMAFAAKTGDVTAKDLPTLTKLSNAMSLFKDPDAMAQTLVEYAGLPRTEDSFLSRVKRVTNAQQDLKQPNSFLEVSITPEARMQMNKPMLQRIAQLVDQFTVIDSADSKKGTALVQGLAIVFGSPESAKAVLDYYAQQNKADLRFDPNEQVRDAAGEIDSEELSSWDGSINERDAGKAAFRFKDAKSMRPFFKGSKDIDAARRDGTLGDESTQTPYSYAEYVKETGKDPEAELNRLFKIIDDLVAEHKKHKKEDRSAMINPLLGERSMVEAAYERGGAEEALSLYEVLRTEAKDQNDLVATDEDLAKYARKKSASRVTFKRTDGTKLMLSAESMWKTFGDNQKGKEKGGSEGDTARARRLFKEAVASVLAREDIASLETSLSGLKIDDEGTEAEPKIDPVLREQLAHELNKASGSLSEIKVGLKKLLKGYVTALSQGNLGKQLVYTTEEMVHNYIANAQKALDDATTAPQRAVLRERLMAYERGLERMLELKQNYLDDGVGGNNNTDEPDPPVFSRVRKEMDTSKGERRVEEDTGAEIESGTRARGAPKTGTGKNVPPGKLEALLNAGASVLRNGVYFITDADATKYLAGTDKHDRIYVNMGKLRESPNALVDYLSSSEPKQKMLELLGVSAEQLQKALGNTKRIASFLRDHERSHVENNDRGVYPKGDDGKLDLDHPTSIAIEARATYDALTESEREKLGITARPKAPAKPAKAAGVKAMTREQIQKEIAYFDAEIARLKAAPLESFRAAAAKDDADSFDSFKKVSINDMNRERAAQIESAEEMKASWEGHLKRVAKKKDTGELGAEVEADVVDVTYYGDDGTTTTHQFAKGSRGHKEALEHKRAGVNVSIVGKAQSGTARRGAYTNAGGFFAMHSSPADHEGVFDWHMFGGSGEGDAAYAAGTYLSTDPRVNSWYRRKFMPDGVSEPIAKAIELAKKALGPGASAKQLRQYLVDSAKVGVKSVYGRLPDNVFTGVPAKTYDVHVDLDPSMFLNWDRPINADSGVYKHIERMLLTSVLPEKPAKDTFAGKDTGRGAFGAPELEEVSVHSVIEDAINDPGQVSGGDFYKALTSWLGSKEKASDLLMEQGIPGVVYRSGSSKGSADAPNYVVFDDQKIQTVNKWSSMKPKRGRPGKIDRQAVIDEIIRTRGKDVKVAVDKLHSALGGSGQYTYDRKTGRRLIEVAINAIDPIGTARHEAMHDFFQFLGENEATRAVARTLKEVMGSKEVMDKLKDLLQGHKDALEQLNDPEERVAYAYQFWAAGALDLGPKSTGIFRTITNFLRDMFGIVTKEQRALDILNAFHDGDFSNVSTVREALFDQAERDGATFWEKMNRMAPALNKAVLAMSSAAPDRLRRFENDSLNALADKFFTDGGKQGFIQNRFQQEGIWSNKLEAAFAGSTAEERRIALEQLQSMKPVSPLAKKLVEFNSEMYDYMSAAGVKTFDRAQKKWVPLRRVNNYFTRSWDGDAIARNRSDFVQLLISEGGLSLDAAEKVADKLINGREERLTPQEQSILGFTPYAVHTAERVFRFIKPGNADKFAKFQRKDIADIMTNYVQQAVYRAEYARSFGNDGRVISDLIAASGITDKDELTAISNTVQAMEGSLDPGKWSSSTKELMSVMMAAQNVILLPLAIVSQVMDPIVLAARTEDLRDAGTAYINGIKRLWNTVSKNGNKVDGEDLAHILGIVSENSTLQAMGMTASTTRMSKRMEWINRKFFRYNGMQGWNNTMRITATAAAERYIIANKDNAEALAELGIAPGDVKMSTVYVPDGKGKLVAKHSLDVSSREVQQAMFKMVDQSVLRPSAANRPVWMSDPRFLLVGHLKQFTFAMHNVVLKRANKQLENGNAKPWLILALAAPAILAADMAKFALTGDMPSSWGFFDYLSHAVGRSGLLGIGDFGTELFSGVGQGKLPGEGLLGPSFEHVAKILRWIGGDPRTKFEDVVDRTIPFAKYI